ncbi:Ribosomal large subunit pseudouridine synthase B [Planctomycetes bacterium MalM25]|nr:Ribosomal large subunit pseudouridine synthase B [Planctomycetes bacterium MalM25]
MAKKSAKRPTRAGAGKKTAKKKGPRKTPGHGAAPKRKPRKRSPGRGGPARIAPADAGERLQKVLAAAGVASRRECEELIVEGRVKVDGQIVSELGARVDPDTQAIEVDGEALKQPKRVYFAVNKPEGVVCTARDPSGRQRVTDLIPPSAGRVFNVGRLDMSSEGLILLTNDGDLANKLTHPRHGVEKLYHVQVAGLPTQEAIAQVRKGVYLDEGRVAFSNVKVKSRKKASTVLEVVLDEGRNREIRRVLARVGHKVQKLQRIAVGPVRLGEMPAGAYRPLTREEITALRAAAEAKPEKKSKPKAAGAKRKSPPHKTKKKTARPAGGRSVIGADDDFVAAKPAAKKPTKKKPTGGGKPTQRKMGRKR